MNARKQHKRRSGDASIGLRIPVALASYLRGGKDNLARKIASAPKPRNPEWGPVVTIDPPEAKRIVALAQSIRAKGIQGGVPGKELSAASKVLGDLRKAMSMPQDRRRRGDKKKPTARPPRATKRISNLLTEDLAKPPEPTDELPKPETLAALAELAVEINSGNLPKLRESANVKPSNVGETVNKPANDLSPPPPPAEAAQVEHVAHHFQSQLQAQIAGLEVILFDWESRCQTMRDALEKLRDLARA